MDFLNKEKQMNGLPEPDSVNFASERQYDAGRSQSFASEQQEMQREQEAGVVRNAQDNVLNGIQEPEQISGSLSQRAVRMLGQERELKESMAGFAERHRAMDDMANADLAPFVRMIYQQARMLRELGEGRRSEEFLKLKQAADNFGLGAETYRIKKEEYRGEDPWKVWGWIREDREFLMDKAFEVRKAAEHYLETHNKLFTLTINGRKRKAAARKLLKLAGKAADIAGYEGTYEWPDQLETDIEKGREGENPAPSYKELVGKQFANPEVEETYTKNDARAHLAFAYRAEKHAKISAVRNIILKTLHLDSNIALAREYALYAEPVKLDDDGKVIPSLPNLKNFEYNVKLAKGLAAYSDHGYFLGTVIDARMKDFPEELRQRIEAERAAFLSDSKNWVESTLDKNRQRVTEERKEGAVWSRMQEHVFSLLPKELQDEIHEETLAKRREAYKDGLRLQIDKAMSIPFHPDMFKEDVFYKYYEKLFVLCKISGTINNWKSERIGDKNGTELLKEVLDEMGIRNQFMAKLKAVLNCEVAANYLMHKFGVIEGKTVTGKTISELLSQICNDKYTEEGSFDENRLGEQFEGPLHLQFEPVVLEEGFFDSISTDMGARKFLLCKLVKEYNALAREREEKLAPLLAKRDKFIAENAGKNLEENEEYIRLQESIENAGVIKISECLPGARDGWIILDKEVKWVINQLAAKYEQKIVQRNTYENSNIAPMTQEEKDWCRQHEQELRSNYTDYINDNYMSRYRSLFRANQ